MRTQPTNTMPALNTDSSSMDKLRPKPRRSRGEGTGRYSNTDSSHQPLQQILNQLSTSPAVEPVSPIHGSRHDHAFYICRLCCSTITHIMNIGAMLHHLTHFHIKDRYNHGDKLTREAFDHLIKIRHLLKQTTDCRIFSIIRSSSDLLQSTTWRGNKVNSGTNSLIMDTIGALDRNTIERKKQPKPAPTSLSKPPTNRNDQVNSITPLALSSLLMINTGLSLNLSHASSPSSTPRLKYPEELTRITDTPQPIDTETNEVNTLGETTTTPRTRNGGVRKGKFDRNHHFRRNRS